MVVLSADETKALVFDMAADAMRGPLFPSKNEAAPPEVANGDLEALIDAAEQELLAAFVEQFAALRAAARATPSIANGLKLEAGFDDLVRPMTILKDYDLSRAELYRRCVEHPIGTPGGFSLRHAGENTYLISRSRFHLHYQQHPPKRRFETKKP